MTFVCVGIVNSDLENITMVIIWCDLKHVILNPDNPQVDVCLILCFSLLTHIVRVYFEYTVQFAKQPFK